MKRLSRPNSRAEFPGISSDESFTYFLLISLKLLKDGGTLSFILPESILHIRRHADIRKYILENCRIKRIDCLGKKFQNVLSSVIRLDLQQRKPDGQEMVMICRSGAQYYVAQNRFSRNKGFVFDVYLNSQDEIMLSKVYETKHITLEGKADWALGIVTGDNGRFLLAEPAAGCEPIYKGSDVSAFRLKKASTYIQFRPQLFQQVAPVHKYRAKEKLIYKFISRTPVFAYDDQGSLTLNSANILIPKVNYPLKAILALFNSSLYAFIYMKKFHALKILRGDLEQLPLPLWDSSVLETIVNLVDKVLKEEEDFSDLDNYILEQFHFTPKEKEYIRATVQAGND
ncbi:MAG: TaqI-like C-terminal specificity domain-containing protein [Desulfitobacteriia bacterium]